MVKKFIIAYGTVPETEVPHMAKFDVLDIDVDSTHLAESIKALNPTDKILCYRNVIAMHLFYEDWTEVDAHEDWFLHDINGNRLQDVQYGYFCMDTRNLEWRQHYANYVKSKLDTYPALDGIFADDVWDVWRKTGWTVPATDVPDIPNFHDGVLTLLQVAKNMIGTHLLIVNTPNNTDYVDVCDGKFDDNFIHASWTAPDYWPPWWTIDNYLARVNLLASISSRGKYYLALDGATLPASPTEEDLRKTHETMLFCLCSYLLGVNGSNAAFGWLNIYARDGSKGYYPEMDTNVGNPRGAYYQVNPDVYGRDFDHAKVFVNFGDAATYEVTVDDTTYSLSPHSGVIAPWLTPISPIIKWWNALSAPKKAIVISIPLGLAYWLWKDVNQRWKENWR